MIRVRVTRALGSTPREAGAEMFVTPDRVTGTIGGVETRGTYPAPGFEAYSRQAVG